MREVVLVRAIGADGAEGWGECSALEAPTYTGEHTDGAWACCATCSSRPRWPVGPIVDVVGHPIASAALADALTSTCGSGATAGRWSRPYRRGPDAAGLSWTAVSAVDVDERDSIAGGTRPGRPARRRSS